MITSKTTTSDVAAWMLSIIEEQGELTQNNAYYQINKQFGAGFTTVTNSGSTAIKGGVLTAFKKISEDTVIWERGEKNGASASSMTLQGVNKIKVLITKDSRTCAKY